MASGCGCPPALDVAFTDPSLRALPMVSKVPRSIQKTSSAVRARASGLTWPEAITTGSFGARGLDLPAEDQGPQVGSEGSFFGQEAASSVAEARPTISPLRASSQTRGGSTMVSPGPDFQPVSLSASRATKQRVLVQMPAPWVSMARLCSPLTAAWQTGVAPGFWKVSRSRATREAPAKQAATSKHCPSPSPVPPPKMAAGA